ncbi:MAG: MFS transporter [Actinomycetes bacterium]
MSLKSGRRLHPAWLAAAVTFLTLGATAGFRAAPSVLLVPLEDAFGWSRASISAAISVNVLVYGLFSPFAAALMERFGIKKVVMIALTVVGSGAFSTIFIQSPWHLIVLWGFVVGSGTGSMALVFAASIANRWFIDRKGVVLGALTAAAATGQLIFLPGLSWLATHHGWKSVSITVACAAWVMVPLIALFLKESPAKIGTTPYGAPDDYVEPPQIKRNAAKEAIGALREASKIRDFWYLTGSFFVCGLSTSGLVGTHFIAAAHDHGMQQVTAAGLLALVGVFDVIGTMASGWMTDKVDPRKLLFFYYLLRGISLFILPAILFQTVHPSTLVFIIFYGLDWVATVPPTIVICRTILGLERSTVIYGWVFASHQIGGSIAALGAALLRTKFGNYSAAFYISGLFCIITCYFVLQIGKDNELTNGFVKVKKVKS